jgi:hypothetical protein
MNRSNAHCWIAGNKLLKPLKSSLADFLRGKGGRWYLRTLRVPLESAPLPALVDICQGLLLSFMQAPLVITKKQRFRLSI